MPFEQEMDFGAKSAAVLVVRCPAVIQRFITMLMRAFRWSLCWARWIQSTPLHTALLRPIFSLLSFLKKKKVMKVHGVWHVWCVSWVMIFWCEIHEHVPEKHRYNKCYKVYPYLRNRFTVVHDEDILCTGIYIWSCVMLNCFFRLVSYLTENTACLFDHGDRLYIYVGIHIKCVFLSAVTKIRIY